MSDIKPYHIVSDGDWDETYTMLKGPNNFECILTEPEDRCWERDGSDAVDRLNEQNTEIQSLQAEVAELRSHLDLLGCDPDGMSKVRVEVERLQGLLKEANFMIGDTCGRETPELCVRIEQALTTDGAHRPGNHIFEDGVCRCGQRPYDDPVLCTVHPKEATK